jgi:hypothetical protein
VKRIINAALLPFVLLALVFLTANSWEILNEPPRSVHQWRQSDGAAQVKTFFRTDANIFTPATFNLAGENGRVASEFPIIYYLAARIQRVVGEEYWVVRGLSFLCYLAGLMALWACLKRWIPNPFLALFPTAILATSPYFYYYALNFLPNVPAICFSFIGFYFFFRHTDTARILPLSLSTLFFALAVTLKPTDGGILWLACLGAWAVQSFGKFKAGKLNKIALLPVFASALLVGLCLLAWVKYVNAYNDLNGNHQNLINILPYWEMDDGLFKYTLGRVQTEWSHVFQHKIINILLVMAFVAFFFLWKRLDNFLRWLTLFLFIGLACYSALWFKAFTDHDYYQLINVVPFVFLIITMLEFGIRVVLPITPDAFKKLGYVLMFLGVLGSFYHNRNVQKERYSDPRHATFNANMFKIEPYLLSIGVTTTDTVICVPDPSGNISLNAINRYGHTEAYNYHVATYKGMGADYLIVSDTAYLTKPLYQPYIQKKVGQFENISVFSLH